MFHVLLARNATWQRLTLNFLSFCHCHLPIGGGGGVAGRYHAARFHEMLEFWMLNPGSCAC